jgi:hypothetical protein
MGSRWCWRNRLWFRWRNSSKLEWNNW